jgi:hypothetical protein
MLFGIGILATSSFFSGKVSASQVIIDATPYLNASKPDYGIQQALNDAAALGGATVQLPAGTFPLETYLELKTGVQLKGAGASTILAAGRNESRVWVTANYAANLTNTIAVSDVSALHVGMIVYVWQKTDLKFKPNAFEITAINGLTITLGTTSVPSGATKVPYALTANVSYVSFGLATKLTQSALGATNPLYTIKVADPSFVSVGEAIMIKSDTNTGEGGWDVETNIVTGIDLNTKTLTLTNDVKVNATAGTVVFHAYGAVFAQGVRSPSVYVTNFGVSDLVIEGWNTPYKPAFHEFYIGGINFVYCKQATISNVTVRYWHSDGVSLQICQDSTVTDVTSTANRGHGFHPGTGSKNIEFLRINGLGNLGFAARGTAGDGLYYCWNNQNVNVRQSVFTDNAGAGVGDLGGGDTNDTGRDIGNTIEDSVMDRNGRAGIDITGGGTLANTMIRRNLVRDNNRSNTGYAGIQIAATKGNAQKFTVDSNIVESTLLPATQLIGIQETNPNSYAANFNVITNNTVRFHSQSNILAIGPNTIVSGNNTTNNPTPTATGIPTTTPITPTATPVTATATATPVTATASATPIAPTATATAVTATATATPITPTASASATPATATATLATPSATAVSPTATATSATPSATAVTNPMHNKSIYLPFIRR